MSADSGEAKVEGYLPGRHHTIEINLTDMTQRRRSAEFLRM